jgi:diphthamide synthase (EF-2-diphthine--ammonia ligase)
MRGEHYAEHLDILCEEIKIKLSELLWHLDQEDFDREMKILLAENNKNYWMKEK